MDPVEEHLKGKVHTLRMKREPIDTHLQKGDVLECVKYR